MKHSWSFVPHCALESVLALSVASGNSLQCKITVDTNTVGLMSIFILTCQKDPVCSFWNRNKDGSVDRPASWVRNVRTSLTVVT